MFILGENLIFLLRELDVECNFHQNLPKLKLLQKDWAAYCDKFLIEVCPCEHIVFSYSWSMPVSRMIFHLTRGCVNFSLVLDLDLESNEWWANECYFWFDFVCLNQTSPELNTLFQYYATAAVHVLLRENNALSRGWVLFELIVSGSTALWREDDIKELSVGGKREHYSRKDFALEIIRYSPNARVNKVMLYSDAVDAQDNYLYQLHTKRLGWSRSDLHAVSFTNESDRDLLCRRCQFSGWGEVVDYALESLGEGIHEVEYSAMFEGVYRSSILSCRVPKKKVQTPATPINKARCCLM